MSKGAFLCLTLLVIATPGWAEKQLVAAKISDPTEINFADLVKMEVPVVGAASKYNQKVTEAPASVTIISSDEIKKYGHRTLADILGTAPGLYINYDRNYSFLGVRGFSLGDYNNRVLLLVNGHRLNNSLSDSAFIGTEFILDVDLIDRVEIIRGPGSSLYGNNAFFGVINVVTRKGRDLPAHGVEVSGEAGSFETYKGRVTYGKLFENGLELLLSGSIYDSQGHDRLFYKEFDTLAQNNGVAQNADSDAFKNAFATLSFKDFSLEGGFIAREKQNPTAQFLTDFNDPRLRTVDDRGYANFKYAHEFPQIVDVVAQVYYDFHSFDIAEPYGGVLYKDAQKADWWGTEVQLTKRIQDQHTFTFGGEFRDDFRQQERFYNLQSGMVSRDLHRSRQNHGIYFQGDVAVVTNLHLNAGVRYDQYGSFDPSFNPRVALIYNPFAETVFKAIYGTAFRAPNFFELSDQRNQGITPETISTYELVYEQGIGDHLRSSLAGFYNQIDDLITFNSAPGHQRFENLSGAEAEGMELALEGVWQGIIRGRASYTFQHAEDSTTGRTLNDSPAHLGKLNLSVPFWQEKIFGGVEFLYISRRTTTHLTPLGTAEPGADASGMGLINLTLFSQNLVTNLDISASVYNLLDKRYGDPSTPFHRQDIIEQDGRSFRVKITYRF